MIFVEVSSYILNEEDVLENPVLVFKILLLIALDVPSVFMGNLELDI